MNIAWDKILREIKTPLGLFALFALIIASIIAGLGAVDTNPATKEKLLLSALALFGLVIVCITYLLGRQPPGSALPSLYGASSHDELSNLRDDLRGCYASTDGTMDRGTPHLRELLEKAAQGASLNQWTEDKARDLMKEISRHCTEGQANNAFWWLIVHGVFRYRDIEIFQIDESDEWEDNISLVVLSRRGIALLTSLK